MAQQLGSNYYNSPFKFNGKELDEETGFYYYGARYYDPKISLWLSVDNEMEKYPNWSPYNYCKQSPISRYDPDGNDDIFTSSGRFVKSTKTGNAVLIQVGDKLLTPSQLSTSRGSRLAMTRIGAHYATKVGADPGTMVTTRKGTDDSDKNPAFTGGNTINLNINGGFSKRLDNINNFKSVMKHENLHKEDNENPKFSGGDLSTHADVYIGQMSDKTFTGTTDDFKIGMAGSFANYLLNMDQRGEYGQNAILDKIDSFNKTNKGGLYIVPPIGNFAQGTLNLDVQYKGETYPIKYEKINE